MRKPEATKKQALLIVQQPKHSRSRIEETIADIASTALQRPGVLAIETYAVQDDRRAALLVVTVDAPRVLKGIVGDGIVACHRDIDTRTASAIARQHDASLAAAALRWSSKRNPPVAHV